MTARTHDAAAFAALVTLATLYPPEKLTILTVAVAIVANNIGGLLPDMDQATNRLWDLLPGDYDTGRTLRKLFIRHRTITHSIVGVLAMHLMLQWVLPKVFNPSFVDPMIVYASFMIGYLSHLATDAFTKDGLPLLFPFQFRFGIPPVTSLRVRTDTWVENLLIFPSFGIYLVWFIWTHQGAVLHLVRSISR